MRTSILALILIAICLPALAVGKVTADPNASVQTDRSGGASVAASDDARLSQKVTLSESRKTVSAILEDLTKSTGVTFKSGYNNNDWQVRDRKMCIFTKDVPLSQVMNSIARVMKFKWERKPAGVSGFERSGNPETWQYRLYMDRRTLLDADSQTLREDERVRAKATEKRKAALEDYANVDNLSPGQLAALKSKDPLMYVFATTGIAGSMGQMFREVPALSEAMAAGEQINMVGADMSDQGRLGITRLLGSIGKLANKLGQGEPGMFDKIDPADVTVSLNKDLDRQDNGARQFIVLADISIQFSDQGQANFPLMNPDSAIGHALGNLLAQLTEGQVDPKDLDKKIQAEVEKATPQDLQAISVDYGEPELQHPEDPALKTKLKLKPDGARLADIQQALAEASSFAIISDSFGKMEQSGTFAFTKDESELGTLLEKLTKVILYNWDKRAAVLEFRDREWFRKRSAQIPEAQVEPWRQAFVKTGTLDLSDLAQIARLDVEQLDLNVGEDEVLGSMDLRSLMWLHRDLLRLYGSLTEAQRSATLSDAGLDFQTLSAEQYALAEKMLRSRNDKFLRNPDARLKLKITRKQEGKQFHYTCTVTTTDDVPPIKGEFTTPKYQEPKKSAKPADAAKQSAPAK